MKVFWIASPLAAAAAFAVVRRVAGRPLAPASLRALVGLVVLVYLAGAAALGLFWVARMELPPFDLHYLAGYCLLAAAAWHLWLEWPVLARFFRRMAPRSWLVPGGERFAPRIRAALGTAGAAGVLAIALLLRWWWLSPPAALPPLQREGPAAAGEAWVPPTPAVRGALAAAPEPQRAAPGSGAEALAAALYILRESSADLRGLVRANPFFGARPRPTPMALVRRALPPPGAGGGAAPSSGRALDLGTVATVLYHAAGVTEVRRAPGGGLALRAAASAGALYPVETYLWADLRGGGTPGLWLYLPRDHELGLVREEVTAEELAAALGVRRAEPPVVVLSGRFQRTVWKYGPRSYRYVALDAGHVAANLWLAATKLGLEPRVRELFDDAALAAALGLERGEEGALLAVALGGDPGFRWQVPPFAPEMAPEKRGGAELTRLAHGLTSWRWVDGTEWRYRPRPGADEFPADPPLAGAEVLRLIRERRSFRRYAPRPLAEAEVRGLLREVGRLARAVPLDEGLGVRVVACRVQGLEPGTYVWEDGWRSVWRGDASRRLYRAGLSQELLERAAMAVVFTLDLERLSGRLGVRGLRVGLLHAGLAGELVYLAAGARGLGACGVGAFADAALRELLGDLPPTTAPVYMVAVGHRR